MSADYLQHGSRHRKQGSDPSPGIGQTPFAKASTPNVVTVAAISGGVPGTAYMDSSVALDYNGDTSVFTATSVVTGGVTVHGIGAITPGHYLMKAQVALTVMTGTGLVEVDNTTFAGTASVTASSYGSTGRRWIRQTGDTAADGWYLEQLITVSSGPYPTGPFTVIVSNNTNATLNAFADILVWQLDDDSTVFF